MHTARHYAPCCPCSTLGHRPMFVHCGAEPAPASHEPCIVHTHERNASRSVSLSATARRNAPRDLSDNERSSSADMYAISRRLSCFSTLLLRAILSTSTQPALAFTTDWRVVSDLWPLRQAKVEKDRGNPFLALLCWLYYVIHSLLKMVYFRGDLTGKQGSKAAVRFYLNCPKRGTNNLRSLAKIQ